MSEFHQLVAYVSFSPHYSLQQAKGLIPYLFTNGYVLHELFLWITNADSAALVEPGEHDHFVLKSDRILTAASNT